MSPEARREIEALAAQHLAQQQPRVVMLTPLDKPDRAWCVPCAKPSLLAWQVVFELGSDFDVRTVSVCTDCGEEWPKIRHQTFAPIRCHRCGWTGP